jgi:hypothetical protein
MFFGYLESVPSPFLAAFRNVAGEVLAFHPFSLRLCLSAFVSFFFSSKEKSIKFVMFNQTIGKRGRRKQEKGGGKNRRAQKSM